MSIEEHKELLNEYRTTCMYLKQICSNKANKYYRYNNYLTRSTVIATIILSAVAFANKEVIANILCKTNLINEADNISTITTEIDFFFNIIVLLVLILSVLNLICRFQERSVEYFHTVTTLSSMIRDINSLLQIEQDEKEFSTNFNIIKIRYNTTLDYLPSHTDQDFLKAKYNIKVKEEIGDFIKNKSIWKIKIWFTRICLGIFLGENSKDR